MSQSALDVIEIAPGRRRERSKFVGLPFVLARAHPAWQPGLRLLADQLVDPHRNPFWRDRPASFFLARRSGTIVGRMAVLDPGVLSGYADAAVLAFPDFVDDPEVSARLLESVEQRARERGARRLVGPMNPDIHHDVGIQVDGQHLRNAAFMGFQPTYYQRHFEEGGGFRPLADFHAWGLRQETFLRAGRLQRLAARVERNEQMHIRAIDLRRFEEELRLFHRLYSMAFQDHWGFTAPTLEEFRFLAGDLKHVLRSRMALVAEWDGQPVGFVLGIPDFFSILPSDTGGRLTPWCLVRTLLRWRSMQEVRVMIAGVLPSFRQHGIHLPLFYRVATEIFDLGFRGGEISWVMEDNAAMTRVLPLLGASVTKTYRLYTKALHQ